MIWLLILTMFDPMRGSNSQYVAPHEFVSLAECNKFGEIAGKEASRYTTQSFYRCVAVSKVQK